jgi:hypothetical protein
MHQGGGIKRSPRFLASELLGSQFTQYVVDQGQQLIRGAGIAVFKNLSEVAHVRKQVQGIFESSGL